MNLNVREHLRPTSKTPLATDAELRTLRELHVLLEPPQRDPLPPLLDDPLDAFPCEMAEMRSLWNAVGEVSEDLVLSNADRRMCAEVMERCKNSGRGSKSARQGRQNSIDDIIASCMSSSVAQK